MGGCLIMIGYDKWKTTQPDELENECLFCGEPCEKTYCCKECRIADNQDRV